MFLIIDSASTKELVLTIGTAGNEMPFIPLVGINPLTAFVSLMASAGIRELSEGSSVSFYKYMRGTPESGFNDVQETGLLRQTIDEYELAQQAKKNQVQIQRISGNSRYVIWIVPGERR